jgi:CheY-like chemotaxis protein
LQLLESDAGFDIVITDYAMPGMTGLDLATRLKLVQPKLPIVLATGYAELPPGAPIDFPRLAKPYTQDQLAEALAASLRSRGV